MDFFDSVLGSMALAAVFAVFAVMAAATGEWTIAGLAYLDAVGMTALAAAARMQAKGL